MADLSLSPWLAAQVERIGQQDPGGDLWDARCARAAEQYRAFGLPHGKDESYRHADLASLFGLDYAYAPERVAPAQPPQSIYQCDLPRLDAYTIFLVNGSAYADGGAGCSVRPNGVVYGSARCAMVEHPTLFARVDEQEERDGISALARCLARDGFFIHVPAGVHLDKPIQVVSLLQGGTDRFVASCSSIVLGEGARAEVVICSHTLSASRFLDNAHLGCHLAQRAQLDLTVMQNAHNQAAQILHLHAGLCGHAVLGARTLTIHGGFTRNNISVSLQEPHAECRLGGMSLLDGTQYADTQTLVHHQAAQCHSSQLYKNIVDGSAKSVFYGIINVQRDAQLTTAYQRAASIMLTEQGAVHARPQLIIHADDVKCSHGATVGQLDDNARFYLRSRGIAAADVDRMLMNAFVGDVLRDIRLVSLRERVESIVEKRLRGERDRCHSGCSALV